MEENLSNLNENVTIYNRERINVTQAVEIVSSTEKEVIVKLEKDIMQILGADLKIIKLIPDEKILSVNGKIKGLMYLNKVTKKSFFGKVFK